MLNEKDINMLYSFCCFKAKVFFKDTKKADFIIGILKSCNKITKTEYNKCKKTNFDYCELININELIQKVVIYLAYKYMRHGIHPFFIRIIMKQITYKLFDKLIKTENVNSDDILFWDISLK